MIELTDNDYRLAKVAASKSARWASVSGAVDFEDLYAEALMGAMRAVETYDPAKGRRDKRVYAYARKYIQKYMLSHGRVVKIPTAKSAGVTYRSISLDGGEAGTSDVGALAEFFQRDCDEDHIESLDIKLDLGKILSKIPKRQADLLLHISRGGTYLQFANRTGVTKQCIQLLHKKAMRNAQRIANGEQMSRQYILANESNRLN